MKIQTIELPHETNDTGLNNMIKDLSKPIRLIAGELPAEIVKNDLPGERPFLVVWSNTIGLYQQSNTFSLDELNDQFENVVNRSTRPITLWVRSIDNDSIRMSAGHLSAEDYPCRQAWSSAGHFEVLIEDGEIASVTPVGAAFYPAGYSPNDQDPDGLHPLSIDDRLNLIDGPPPFDPVASLDW